MTPASNHDARDDPRPRRSPLGLLRALLALTIVIPVLLFVIAALLNRSSALGSAERDLLRISEIGREHAARVFDSLDQAADRVVELATPRDQTELRANEEQVHTELAAIVSHLPQVQSVLLAGRDGHPIASARKYPVPRDVDVSWRDYFRDAVEGAPGSHISTLQTGEINVQPFFGLSRRWNGPAGDLQGVIDVAVAPLSFVDFYRTLLGADDTDGCIVTLVRADGQILVRYPPIEGPPPRAPKTSAFFAAIEAAPQSGTYRSVSIVDTGSERLFAYSRVPGFPLYVVAGRTRSAILTDWYRTMASHLIFGLPATLTLFALGWVAIARTRREESALLVARQEIVRREAAEASLLRAQRLEAVGQLTGGIAHDINNILTIIVGNAELLERRPEDALRSVRLAGNILTASRRGAELTQKLLAFSRRQMVRPRNIDLNAVITDLAAVGDRDSGVHELRLHLDPGLDLVRADRGQFETALSSLLGNARDAMPAGGAIEVATETVEIATGELPPGRYVSVCVIDSGCGMDAAMLARAVEPFVTSKDVGQGTGTGLGLSLVHGFVSQAGGALRMDSQPGRGTRATMLLPSAGPADAVAPRPVAAAASPDAVVLVVEDEPGVRELALAGLSDLGYGTVSAPDGNAALALLRGEGRIDLLFSDIVMPGGINGVQLVAQARLLRPGLRAVLTTGYAAPELGRDLPDDVPILRKPYDRAKLAEQLRTALSD